MDHVMRDAKKSIQYAILGAMGYLVQSYATSAASSRTF